MNRNATSSRQRRSIARAERTPTAYAYTNSASHHLRLMRRPAMPVQPDTPDRSRPRSSSSTASSTNRAKCSSGSQSIKARRQQQHLLTITRQKVLGHQLNRLKPAGQHRRLRDTLRAKQPRDDRLARCWIRSARHRRPRGPRLASPGSIGALNRVRRFAILADVAGISADCRPEPAFY